MSKKVLAALALATMLSPVAAAAPADSTGDIPLCCIEDSACCYEGDRGCCYGDSDSRGGCYRGGYGRGCRW